MKVEVFLRVPYVLLFLLHPLQDFVVNLERKRALKEHKSGLQALNNMQGKKHLMVTPHDKNNCVKPVKNFLKARFFKANKHAIRLPNLSNLFLHLLEPSIIWQQLLTIDFSGLVAGFRIPNSHISLKKNSSSSCDTSFYVTTCTTRNYSKLTVTIALKSN